MGEHYLDTVGVRSSILLVPTRLYAVVVVALAACGFKPTAAAGDDGLAPGDAAVDAPDAGPMFTGPCGSTGAIRDNFDDGAIDNEWRASGMTMETGGVLAVSPDSSTIFAGYLSKHRVDLTGTNVAIEVPQMVDTSTNALAALYLVADSSHYVAITQLHGTLNAEWNTTGGAAMDVGSTYDPLKDRWWRISEASGTVTFEVSADGTTFAPLATVASPTWINDLEIAIGGYSDGIAHGSVHFDNLDDKLDLAGWCKADTFSDHFMRMAVGYDWTAGGAGRRRLARLHRDGNERRALRPERHPDQPVLARERARLRPRQQSRGRVHPGDRDVQAGLDHVPARDLGQRHGRDADRLGHRQHLRAGPQRCSGVPRV